MGTAGIDWRINSLIFGAGSLTASLLRYELSACKCCYTSFVGLLLASYFSAGGRYLGKRQTGRSYNTRLEGPKVLWVCH